MLKQLIFVALSSLPLSACSTTRAPEKTPVTATAAAPSTATPSAPARVAAPAPATPLVAARAPSATVPAQAAEKDAPAKKTPVYDEQAVGADQIATALARAKRDNRRVLVQWGANWCGWCIKLHDLMKSDAKLKKELSYEYEVVKIDIGKWNKHMELAAKYGADLQKHGVPYLTVLDADGKLVANQDTGSFEDTTPDTARHDPAKVLEFLTQQRAPQADASKLYEAALARAKAEKKRVFLHFGAPWCVWCHRLEDWMGEPAIAALLAKDYIDLEIDIDRALGGADMLKRMRAEEQGIPWFVLLDSDGKVLADSTGPQGNIGFPAKPEELAHFKSMLAQARLNLTPAEIETLGASLTPKN
jgi:thiol:disulfide interchange protein